MTDMWTDASRDVQAERSNTERAKAMVALADLRGFLCQASSEAEYEDRLALVREDVDQIVAATVLLPADRQAVYDTLRSDALKVAGVEKTASPHTDLINQLISEGYSVDYEGYLGGFTVSLAGRSLYVQKHGHNDYAVTVMGPTGPASPIKWFTTETVAEGIAMQFQESAWETSQYELDRARSAARRREASSGDIEINRGGVGYFASELEPGEKILSGQEFSVNGLPKTLTYDMTIQSVDWDDSEVRIRTVDGQTLHTRPTRVVKIAAAGRAVVCGACGHEWTTKAQYRLACPQCGAEESVRAASKTAAIVCPDCAQENWVKWKRPSLGPISSIDPIGTVCTKCGKRAFSVFETDPTLVPASRKTAWIEQARQVVQNHQHTEVEGVLLDATTANGLVQMYDALNPENQAKFEAMPLTRAVDILWKAVGAKAAADSAMSKAIQSYTRG